MESKTNLQKTDKGPHDRRRRIDLQGDRELDKKLHKSLHLSVSASVMYEYPFDGAG